MDRIEIINTDTGDQTVFPCNKWLSKNKEDGEIERDLYPLISQEELRKKSSSRSPQSKSNSFYDDYDTTNRRRGMAYDEDEFYDQNYRKKDKRRNEY